MKVSISNRSGIKSIPQNTNEIHLVRPLNKRAFEELLKKCPSLEKISLSKSCYARLPEKTKKMVNEKGIGVKIESRRGRAIGIGLEKMLHVIEMRKDFQPLRAIESTTGIPKSTIHYLTKYSNREKIKRGKDILYLK